MSASKPARHSPDKFIKACWEYARHGQSRYSVPSKWELCRRVVELTDEIHALRQAAERATGEQGFADDGEGTKSI